MRMHPLETKSTPHKYCYQSQGETRTKTPFRYGNLSDRFQKSKENGQVLHNIKYITVREQIDAMSNHYNLKLTDGTAKLLMELYGLKDIAIPEISVDDKSGKNVMSKIQKTFEDKMHVMYTRIADMGLLQHNLRKE